MSLPMPKSLTAYHTPQQSLPERAGATIRTWLAYHTPRAAHACLDVLALVCEPFLRGWHRARASWCWAEADKLRAMQRIATANVAESEAQYRRCVAELRGIDYALQANERSATKAEIQLRRMRA